MLATLPRDLSPWSMFVNADIVVQAVMVGLAFASLVTWTVWLAKGIELLAAKRKPRRALRLLIGSRQPVRGSARDCKARDPKRRRRRSVQAALTEAERSAQFSPDGIKERLAIGLSRIEARAGRAHGARHRPARHHRRDRAVRRPVRHGLGHHEFLHRHQPGADDQPRRGGPGIAEALLATAIGLVAAIPAVIIYNVFARAIAGYRALLGRCVSRGAAALSRDLERGPSAPRRRSAPQRASRPVG